MRTVEVFRCPICGLKKATIFAWDNPFVIFKCPECGFIYYSKGSGEAVKGFIEGERPYGSRCMEGVFVSLDGKIRTSYYRTPNAPYGGSFLDFLVSMVEELQKELKEGEAHE